VELNPSVAFESDESGTNEIRVARFPSSEGSEQLSRGGGTKAAWSLDGKPRRPAVSDGYDVLPEAEPR